MKKTYVMAGAVCLVVGSLVQVMQYLISPISGDMPTALLLEKATTHHDALAFSLVLDIPLLLIVPAVLFAGYLAGSRTSLFAGVATAVCLLSGISAGVLIANDVVVYEGSTLPDRVSAVALVDGYANNFMVLSLTVFYLLSHVVGFALLGIALWRSRAVPVVIAAGLAVWPLLEMVGYGNNNTWIAGTGYALQAIAFCFCAAKLVGKERTSTDASMQPAAVTPQWSS